MRLTALRIALLYAAAAAAWIAASDEVVARLPLDERTLVLVNVLKGWTFVVVTAVALWALIRALVAQIGAAHAAADRAARETESVAESLRLAVAAEGAVVRSSTEQALFESICRALVADGRLRWAWIGLAEPDGSVRMAASAGQDRGYAAGLTVRWDDTPLGRGPTGQAIRTRRTFVIDDVTRDAHAAPWRNRMLAAGIHASVAIPVVDGDEIYGVMNVYAATPGAIHNVLVLELERVARDLAFAIRAIRTRDERDLAIAAELETGRRLAVASDRYRRLAEASPLSISVIDPDGTVLEWNPAAEAMWGVPASEAIGRFVPFVRPEDADEARALFRRVAEGAVIVGQVRERVRPDGTPVKVRVSNARIVDADGRVAVLGIAEDVTQQEAAQDALERSLRRLDGLHRLDQAILGASTEQEVARAAAEHLGRLLPVDAIFIGATAPSSPLPRMLAAWQPPDAPPMPIPPVLPPDAFAPLPDLLAAAAGLVELNLSEAPVLGPVLRVTRDAGVRHWLGAPLRGSDGDRLGGMSILSRERVGDDPVTREIVAEVASQLSIALQQMRYRSAVAERDARLRVILERSPNPVFTTDRGGRIRFANEAAGRAFRAPDGLVGHLVSEFVPPEHRNRHPGLIAGYFDAPTGRAMTDLPHVEAVRLDGTPFPVVIQLAPIDGPDGPEVIVTVVDLSDRIALEQQLAQAQRIETLGQFAGILAHDVRSYVSAIGWSADALEEGLPEGDPLRRDVELIQRAVEEARAMTRSVLEFARPSPERGVCELAGHVARIGGIVDRLLGAEISLDVDIPNDLPAVALDPASVTQVLVNLATNAREAMPSGGTFSIAAHLVEPAVPTREDHAPSPATARVRLEVSDTGRGMSAEAARRAFEAFYTARAADGVGDGVGLGLASVALQVARAGGTVTLDTLPGVGTTFRIELPVADASPAA